MSVKKPNIIYSSFPRSGSSSIDHILKQLLEPIGYFVTPFGIEGSASIISEIAGKKEPFYHWTHAHPGLFEPFLKNENYRFIYQYRDPRNAVVSWALKEIIEGNVLANFDLVRRSIIYSKYNLMEHMARAREWIALDDRVCLLEFEKMKENLEESLKKILEFSDIATLIDSVLLESALTNVNRGYYRARQKKEDARLTELGLQRPAVHGLQSWEISFSSIDKLLFKKVAGDFLIELGYESDFDW